MSYEILKFIYSYNCYMKRNMNEKFKSIKIL